MYKFWTFLLSHLLTQGAFSQAFQLDDLLRMARDEHAKLKSQRIQIEGFQEQHQQLDATFEPQWQSRLSYDTDHILTQQQFSPTPLESLKTQGLQTQVQQKLSCGTELSAKIDIQSMEASWPISTSLPGTKIHNSTITVGAQQPLLKGWMTPEVSLRKEGITAKEQQALFGNDGETQNLQSQLEQLYWSAAAAKSQIATLRRKSKLTREFKSLMKKRQSIGLADDVAIAEAIRQDLGMTNVLTQKEHDFERQWESLQSLGFLTKNFKPENFEWLPPHKHSIGLQDRQKDILDQALENSTQLKNLDIEKKAQLRQLEIFREQQRPDLKLGLEFAHGGQGDTFSDSTKNRKNKTTFFLTFQMPINNNAFASQSRSIQVQIRALDEQEKYIRHHVQSQVQKLLAEHRRLGEHIDLIHQNIKALKRLRDAESRKVSQARSDRVLMIRYELDALDLESQHIDLASRQHQLNAQLKYQTASYPKAGVSL